MPTGQTVVHEGDTVIAYGRLDHLVDLDERHKGRLGDLAHMQAVQEQEQLLAEAHSRETDDDVGG